MQVPDSIIPLTYHYCHNPCPRRIEETIAYLLLMPFRWGRSAILHVAQRIAGSCLHSPGRPNKDMFAVRQPMGQYLC